LEYQSGTAKNIELSHPEAVTIASELLLREPIKMFKGNFSILKLYYWLIVGQKHNTHVTVKDQIYE
jgi:hypothetical protein